MKQLITNLFQRIKLNFNTLLILSFIAGFLLIETCDETAERDRMNSLEQIIQSQTEILDKKINSLNQSVTTATISALDKQALEIGSKWDPELIDIKNRLKANSVKINQLISAVQFTASAIGEGYAIPTPNPIDYSAIDSLFAKHNLTPANPNGNDNFTSHEFNFEDGYLDLRSQFLTKGEVTPEDKMFFNYTYSVGEVFVDIYSERKPFGKTKYRTDISFANPNMDVKTVTAVTRDTPQLRWVFGPSAGVGMSYVNGKVQPVFNIGISGTLPIIKIYDK